MSVLKSAFVVIGGVVVVVVVVGFVSSFVSDSDLLIILDLGVKEPASSTSIKGQACGFL